MKNTFSQIKNSAGFTLIEVLIYIAFFTLIAGVLLGFSYQIIAASDQVNNKIALQQEADFILRKIDWALSGAAAAAVGPNPSEITITRFFPPSTVIFRPNGNFIDIDSGAGAMDLNSQNVILSGLIFTVAQAPGQPEKIQANFNLANTVNPSGSRNFQLTEYLQP